MIRIRIEKFYRYPFYALTACLLLTGALWRILENYFRTQTEFGEQRLPIQSWVLVAHGVSAAIALWILGVLFPIHMRKGWLAKRNKKSGTLLSSIFLILAGTGLLLYYASHESLRLTTAWLHEVVGYTSVPVLIAHILIGRAISKSSSGKT